MHDYINPEIFGFLHQKGPYKNSWCQGQEQMPKEWSLINQPFIIVKKKALAEDIFLPGPGVVNLVSNK